MAPRERVSTQSRSQTLSVLTDASYKMPRAVRLVASVSTTSSGKIMAAHAGRRFDRGQLTR